MSKARSTQRNSSSRVHAKYGENISFIASYLFKNPGANSTKVRKALCLHNGIEWTNSHDMRGQYTTYFTTGWIGGRSWPKNPCGRYWTRMVRPDGKTGHLVTIEGICKVNLAELQ